MWPKILGSSHGQTEPNYKCFFQRDIVGVDDYGEKFSYAKSKIT